MNQKKVKELRRYLEYHPHGILIDNPNKEKNFWDKSLVLNKKPREYITFQSGWRVGIKYVVNAEDNSIKAEPNEIPMYQVMYDDQLRKLYKSMKKKYINPNANQMTHFQYEESETTEEIDAKSSEQEDV